MRLCFTILIAFHLGCFAQAQWVANFENSSLDDWLQWPKDNWSVTEDKSGNNVLQHSFDNSGSGTASIFRFVNIDLDAGNTSWQFQLKHGYNPSSSNKWAVILSTNTAGEDLFETDNTKGYALGVNLKSNNDTLSFYKIKGSQIIELCATSVNWQNDIGTDRFVSLRADRSNSGQWTILMDTSNQFSNWIEVGSAIDQEIQSAYYFGLYYKYTSSQDQKLYFDNLTISGSFISDNEGPELIEAIPIKSNCLRLVFNENISYEPDENFLLNGEFKPIKVNQISGEGLELVFDTIFYLENNLKVVDIKDLSGNIMEQSTISFQFYKASAFDVLIDEIMFDPVPSIKLPEKEYIELLNTAPYIIYAHDWQICVDRKCKVFDFQLNPQDVMVLCDKKDTADFSIYGHVCGIDGLPSLSNGGAQIELKDNKANVIHFVEYVPEWHKNIYKREGGWSLELQDPTVPCLENTNWSSSVSNLGGSPGGRNIKVTVTDYKGPELKRVSVLSDQAVQLHFSENLYFQDLFRTSMYTTDPLLEIRNVSPASFGYKNLTIDFAEPMKNSKTYTLTVNESICDCAGNSFEKSWSEFAAPQFPEKQDLLINEVLFEGNEWGAEFIEIYNCSNKVIDLDDIRIGIKDDITFEVKNVIEVAPKGFLLFPDSYIALSNNMEGLLLSYYIENENTVYKNSWNSLNNEKATLVLCDVNLNVIDEVQYKKEYHHPMLGQTDGVSLERVSPFLSSTDPSNWHSASATSGFATPGYKNSQMLYDSEIQDIVAIEPEVFSPDNDGFNDVAGINFQPVQKGAMASIYIFNQKGIMVRQLATNALLGNENIFVWNGMGDDGRLEPMGIYIIFIQLIYQNGNMEVYKKKCVLANKLD